MKRCLQCSTGFASEGWACPHCAFTPVTEDGFLTFAPEFALAIAGYDTALFDAHGGDDAERSFWTRSRSALILWALKRYSPRCRSFLEIGCGTGTVLAAVERARPDVALVGAEALSAGLSAARRRVPRATLLQLDATDIPFENEFDAAGAFDVIEHIEDDAAVIRATARAVVPGGLVMLTVPQHPALWGPADVAARHVRRYTARQLRAAVEHAGLRVECLTSFVSLLFPAMAAARFWARHRGGGYDSADEFRIGLLNPFFGLIMDLERWTIRSGVRWPFGGSLLLVARKSAA